MNISKSEILRKLPIFNNTGKILIKDQDTKDIIKAIVKAHEQYKSDYDKICSLFYTGNNIETAKNIFNYLKSNVNYVIESDDLQQIKSPSAIFATPSSDCKNYALAINGILDACRRKYGMDCELCYRFAAYDGTRTPQHVFAVMIINGEEIWIDPVLDYFNEDKQPDYYKDKKIQKMALMALSGIDPYKNIQTSETRSGLAGFNFSNISSLISSPVGSGVLSAIPFGTQAGQILTQITNLFGNKPSRNDWQGWDGLDSQNNYPPGRTPVWWTITDGDSVENEANNILSYISKKTNGMQKVLDAAKDVWNLDKDAYLFKLYDKLNRGGYGDQVAAIKAALTPLSQSATGGGGSSFVNAGGSTLPPPPTTETKTAGISPLIILALVGAGAAMFLGKKK